MFASRSTDVGSDLPLWAVQADSKPGVSTVHTFMGGWMSAFAKQYTGGESSFSRAKWQGVLSDVILFLDRYSYTRVRRKGRPRLIPCLNGLYPETVLSLCYDFLDALSRIAHLSAVQNSFHY